MNAWNRPLWLAGPLCAVVLTACQPSAQPPAGAEPAAAASAAASAPGAAGAPAVAASGAGGGGGGGGGKGGGAGGPVSVTVAKVRVQDMPVMLRTTGTVVALSSVEVRPQMTGTVRQVHFKEGQFVRAGQPLFTLDARTEEANLAKAQAQLAKDSASLKDAQRQLERARQLVAQGFVSQGAADTAQAQVDAWTATVAADQAAVQAAQVALSYARITAPGSGRAGAVAVYPGSLVVANQTPLVTLTQLDPVGVSFTLPQRQLPRAVQALADGGAPVQVKLPEDETVFKGKLRFVDSVVDAANGSVRVKAVLPNPDQRLWPGAFVEVAQRVDVLAQALVVPQLAVIESVKGPMVYAVVDGKAVPKPVKVLHADRGQAAVEGVAEGDAVVVDGRQNVRPNAAVVVREPGSGKGAGAGKGGGGGGGGMGGGGAGAGGGDAVAPAAPGASGVPGAGAAAADGGASAAGKAGKP